MPKPEVVPNIDMRDLPIGPEEAFVLSRVDGKSSEHEIVLATGLESERVKKALSHLASVGAIRFPSEGLAPAMPTTPPAEVGQPVAHSDGTATARAGGEAVDLDSARQHAILETHRRLDELTHYELLGTSPTADKKVIKEAYFQAVALFHPDRYYGKSLGSYKAKLERIFQRMTEAHDVLTRSRSRQEYDQYLVTKNRNRAFEQALSTPPGPPEEAAPEVETPTPSAVDAAEDLCAARGRAQALAAEARSPSNPGPRTVSQPSITISDAPGSPSTAPGRPSDPDVRRRALARKLSGMSMPPAASGSIPPDSTTTIREKVADDLRRHRDQRLAQAHQSQVRRYVDAAEQALAANSLLSAANNFRIALSLLPGDPALTERLKQAEAQAAAGQAESFLTQAEYEERHGKYAEAAHAYERACAGKPSAASFERLAFCLVECKGDARKALDYAKRAVALMPDQTSFRITLSRAFLHAGMRQSALGELERALQLRPDDKKLKDWIQRIKRHEV